MTWAMAVDAVPPMRIALHAMSVGIGLAFRRAAYVLDQKLTAGVFPPSEID